MKWKMEYECTENEFINWTNVLGGVINKMIDANTLRRAALKAANAFAEELETETPSYFSVRGGFDEDEDSEGEDENEFNEQPIREQKFPEPVLNEHQQFGKDELRKILNEWVINFDTDEEPQPDRGEMILQLGNDGKRAGAVISYCMKVGGLTKAIWNIAYEQFISGRYSDEFERALITDNSDSIMLDTIAIRKVAGNICQISSIHLGMLADQFEYPSPLSIFHQ